MIFSSFFFLRMALMLGLLLCPGLFAASTASTDKTFLQLNVISSDSISDQTGQSRYNFGSVTSFRANSISHIFIMQNGNSLPIVVSEARPACGCTGVVIGKDAARLPFNLPPGQQLSVQVTVDVTRLSPGPVDKAVWVYAKGQETPVATLEMVGTIVPAAHLSREVLDFGAVSYGASPQQALTVTLDQQNLPAGDKLRFVCSNPDVQATPTFSNPAAPDARVYQIMLSPTAPLGQVRGTVEIFAGSPSGNINVGEVPLQGEVVGEVSAMPSILAFGTLSAGKAASQQVILTLKRSEKLRVTSAVTYVSGQVRPSSAQQGEHPFGSSAPTKSSPARGQSSHVSMLLDITLSGAAPSGPLNTSVTVTTESGRRCYDPIGRCDRPGLYKCS